MINRGGINRVIELELSDSEMQRFTKSAETLRAIQEEFFPAK